MEPGRDVIEVNFEELATLLARARQGPLSREDCQRLQAAIHALSYLIEVIGEKDTTITRLRALLAKPRTEKTSKVLEQAGIKAPPRNSPPPNANEKPKPGHGRNGAAAYRGACPIKIAHAVLKPGGLLSALFEEQGLRTEGTGSAHLGSGPSAHRSHGLRVGTAAL